jgi:hypothetical protein
MLTVTLRSLEADGLVIRTIYPEVPPRVEYCLSKSGHTLLPHLDNLVNWAVENMQDIVKTRQDKSTVLRMNNIMVRKESRKGWFSLRLTFLLFPSARNRIGFAYALGNSKFSCNFAENFKTDKH